MSEAAANTVMLPVAAGAVVAGAAAVVAGAVVVAAAVVAAAVVATEEVAPVLLLSLPHAAATSASMVSGMRSRRDGRFINRTLVIV